MKKYFVTVLLGVAVCAAWGGSMPPSNKTGAGHELANAWSLDHTGHPIIGSPLTGLGAAVIEGRQARVVEQPALTEVELAEGNRKWFWFFVLILLAGSVVTGAAYRFNRRQLRNINK
jgi:hypothetical protein